MSNLLLVTAFFRKLSSILFSCIYRPKLRPQKKVHQHSLRLSREVSLQEHYRFWTVWMKKKNSHKTRIGQKNYKIIVNLGGSKIDKWYHKKYLDRSCHPLRPDWLMSQDSTWFLLCSCMRRSMNRKSFLQSHTWESLLKWIENIYNIYII